MIHTSQAVAVVVARIITTVPLLPTTAAHHHCLHLSNTLTIMESTHQLIVVVELIPPQEEAVGIKFSFIHSRMMVVVALVDKMITTMTIIIFQIRDVVYSCHQWQSYHPVVEPLLPVVHLPFKLHKAVMMKTMMKLVSVVVKYLMKSMVALKAMMGVELRVSKVVRTKKLVLKIPMQ
jgi:hypothetical protein